MSKIGRAPRRRGELAAYAAAGCLTTAVNYAVYSVLTVFCGLGVNRSNIIACAAAIAAAFLSNKAFVFQSRDWAPRTVFREGALFTASRLLSAAVSVGLTAALMRLGVTWSVMGVPGAAAKFLAECAGMVLSYFLSIYAVFRRPPDIYGG